MDGTESLSDAEYRAYDVLCNLMYLNDGPIVRHERGIAARCNQATLKFRIALDALIKMKKIEVVEGGKLFNKRVAHVLSMIGKKPGKQTTNLEQTHDQPTTNPSPTQAQPPRGLRRKPLKSLNAESQHTYIQTNNTASVDASASAPWSSVKEKSGHPMSPNDMLSDDGTFLIRKQTLDEWQERFKHIIVRNIARTAMRKLADYGYATPERRLAGIEQFIMTVNQKSAERRDHARERDEKRKGEPAKTVRVIYNP